MDAHANLYLLLETGSNANYLYLNGIAYYSHIHIVSKYCGEFYFEVNMCCISMFTFSYIVK